MPALPVVPGVCRIDVGWQVGTDLTAADRLFFSYTGGSPSSADCLAAATDIHGYAVTHLVPLLSEVMYLNDVRVTDMASVSGGDATYTDPVAGTRSVPGLSAQVCALVAYTIGRRYRGGKPRSYFPFGVSTDLGGEQIWSDAFVTAVNTGLGDWLGQIIDHAWGAPLIDAHVNVSYYSGFTSAQNPVTKRWRNIPTPRAVPVVDGILGFACDKLLGTQRRRIQR